MKKTIYKLLLSILLSFIIIYIDITLVYSDGTVQTPMYNDSGLIGVPTVGVLVWSDGSATYNGTYTGAVPNSTTPGVSGDPLNCFQTLFNPNCTYTGWGIFVSTNSLMDMSSYSTGSLKFWINSSTTSVQIQASCWHNGAQVNSIVTVNNYGYTPSSLNTWMEITVPISAFVSSGLVLNSIMSPFCSTAVNLKNPSTSKGFYIDNVRWCKPGGKVTQITLSPSSAFVRKGNTQTFTPTCYNASSQVLVSTLAWSVQYSTVGTASPANGNTTVFTAGPAAVPGAVTKVYAKQDGVTGTATVGITGLNGPGATSVHITNNQFYVAGSSIAVKGFCGEFTPVGQGSNYDWSASTVNYMKDIDMMKACGANTVRLYKEPQSANAHTALTAFSNEGIYIIMTDSISASDVANDPTGTLKIIPRFKQFILNHMDYPYVLCWCVGNEVNTALTTNYPTHPEYLADWYVIVDSCAKVAHEMETAYGIPNHPVTTANAEIAEIGNATDKADDAHMTHLDFWSTQVYRGPSFGTLFTAYKSQSAKPLLITEFGCDDWNSNNDATGAAGFEDQSDQSQYISSLWNEIKSNLGKTGCCLGGAVFQWHDEWWKITTGNNSVQDKTGTWQAAGYTYDPYMNDEWWGVCAISTNSATRTVRQAYYTLQRLWLNKSILTATINGGQAAWNGTLAAGSYSWKLASYPIVVNADTSYSNFAIQIYTDNQGAGASPKYTGPTSTTTGKGFNLVGVSSTCYGLAMAWKVTDAPLVSISTPVVKNNSNGTQSFTDGEWKWLEDRCQPNFVPGSTYIRVWDNNGIYWADAVGGGCPSAAAAPNYIYLAARLNGSKVQQYKTNRLVLEYLLP